MSLLRSPILRKSTLRSTSKHSIKKIVLKCVPGRSVGDGAVKVKPKIAGQAHALLDQHCCSEQSAPLISIPLHVSSVHQLLPRAIESGNFDSSVRKRVGSTTQGEFQLLLSAFFCDIRSKDWMVADGVSDSSALQTVDSAMSPFSWNNFSSQAFAEA